MTRDGMFIWTGNCSVYQSLVQLGYSPASHLNHSGIYVLYNDPTLTMPAALEAQCVYTDKVFMSGRVV